MAGQRFRMALIAAERDTSQIRELLDPFIIGIATVHIPIWYSWNIGWGESILDASTIPIQSADLIFVIFSPALWKDQAFQLIWKLLQQKDPQSVVFVHYRADSHSVSPFRIIPENPVGTNMEDWVFLCGTLFGEVKKAIERK